MCNPGDPSLILSSGYSLGGVLHVLPMFGFLTRIKQLLKKKMIKIHVQQKQTKILRPYRRNTFLFVQKFLSSEFNHLPTVTHLNYYPGRKYHPALLK